MATREELIEALKKADKAGNTEDAKKLAAAIRNMPQKEEPNVAQKMLRDTGKSVVGLGETAMTMLTGAGAEVVAGGGGILAIMEGLVTGQDDVMRFSEDRINAISNTLTYTPQTEAGRAVLGTVARPLQKLQQSATAAGSNAQEVVEPILGREAGATAGAATKTVLEGIPGVLGMRVKTPKVKGDLARIQQDAEKAGVDLGAKPQEMTEQIVQSAEQETGGMVRGDSMEAIAESVKIAKEQARQLKNELYEEARKTEARIPLSEIKTLNQVVKESLKTYDVDVMPIVQKRLKELNEIADITNAKDAHVKMNALALYRQRLGKKASATDTSQNAALGVMKGQVNNFLQDMYNSDMISGNPEAIAKWKKADKAHEAYKQMFKEDKVIRDLAQREADPIEMRNWVFGASQTGFKAGAARITERLKQIVGEDSPQFQAMRQDALLTIMEPLLREEPNLKQFVKNYDRLVASNKPLAESLFPESTTALRQLREFASKVEKNPELKKQFPLGRVGAVAMFGHGIARAALKVKGAEALYNLMAKQRQHSRRRKMIANVLGYDADAPMLSGRVPGIPAAGQAVTREQENMEE